jgi:hypothetical protein
VGLGFNTRLTKSFAAALITGVPVGMETINTSSPNAHIERLHALQQETHMQHTHNTHATNTFA